MSFGIDESAMSCSTAARPLDDVHAAPEPPARAARAWSSACRVQLALDVLRGVCL